MTLQDGIFQPNLLVRGSNAQIEIVVWPLPALRRTPLYVFRHCVWSPVLCVFFLRVLRFY